MPPTAQSPWQRRFRRLFFFVGTASTFYILSSYILDRMRESRLKAIKEKKQRELMKNHFTSLISTISFTLYALLPTLQPQVFDAYPVESTSQALQGISAVSLSESTSSVETGAGNGNGEGSGTAAPDNSLHLYGQNNGGGEQGEPTQSGGEKKAHEGEATDHGSPAVSASSGTGTGVGASWASEFQRREEASGDETAETETEAESEIMVGSSVGNFETDDGMSSIVSQSISLPPTDISSTSPSPPSDLSHSAMLHHSPPRDPAPRSAPVTNKGKKELWKDLKTQSIARTITTAYLLPMLYLLTSSQLSVLARNRYLQDIKSTLAEASKAKDIPAKRPARYEEDDGYRTPRRNTSEATLSGLDAGSNQKHQQKRGWFSSFSIEAMGLSEFVEGSASLLPNPVGLLPERVTNYLPAFIVPSSEENQTVRAGEVSAAEAEEQKRQEDEEAERLFLTYSWWLLHEGWKGVAGRVDGAVEKVFGSMPLKRQLSVHDWERALKEVRAEVEMDLTEENELKLHDFTSNMIPSSPPTSLPIPFPLHPRDHSAHLASLVGETLSHLQSPDGRYILEKGVSAMVKNLTESLAEECYGVAEEDGTRRLAECLPEISRWGKGVWEGVPDSGIEEMLAVPEFEGFSALIFGDWASK